MTPPMPTSYHYPSQVIVGRRSLRSRSQLPLEQETAILIVASPSKVIGDIGHHEKEALFNR